MTSLEPELLAHGRSLRALARALVGSTAADDLVQDTALQALRQPPHRAQGLRGWLRAVLRHRAHKHRRAEARRSRREQAAAPPPPPVGPLQLAAHKETVQRLHQALMALPEPYLGTLLLRFFEDLQPATIAARTGVPVATVKSRLQRGVALLRERLGAADGDWRAALAAAFGLAQGPWVPAIATTGALLMASTTKLALGAAVAALAWMAWWTGGGEGMQPAAPDAPLAGAAPAALPPAAAAEDLCGEAPQRQAVASAAAGPPLPARLRLRLVDATERAPLPHYRVQVRPQDQQSGDGAALTTDALGELDLDLAQSSLPLQVHAVDDPECPVSYPQSRAVAAADVPRDGAALELSFTVGPTYRLLFANARPDGRLWASLGDGTAPNREGDASARVRDGTPPWVRLDRQPSRLSGDGPWSLTVRDESGRWLGWGPVERIAGVQPTPVVLRGEARGVIDLRVTVAGCTIATPFHATPYAFGDGGALRQAARTLQLEPRRTDLPYGNDGHGRFELLVPGRYRVWVGGAARPSRSADVDVAAGEIREVAVDFPEAVDLLSLEVVLRSQSGNYDVAGTLCSAHRVDGTGVPQIARWAQNPRVGNRQDGQQLRFDALTPGEWEVRIAPTPHLPPWDRTAQRVFADAGSIEFVCLDTAVPPPVTQRLAIVAAGSDEPVPFAGVTTFVDGTQHRSTTADEQGGAAIGGYRPGQTVSVLVRAPGRAPAWRQLRMPDEPGPPLLVGLAPGWGTLLVVVGPGARHSFRGVPLAGIPVLADGIPVGVTDERGLLLVSLPQKPARLEVRAPGYAISHGDIDPVTFAPDNQQEMPSFVAMRRL